MQAGTAAAVVRAVSDASTAPDEPAAEAAVTAISPAAVAAARAAVIRRAVTGRVGRYFMSGRPVCGRDPLFAVSSAR